MSLTLSGDHNKNRTPSADGASVMLRGTVEQIVSSLGKHGSDVVQVVFEDGEPLYREIRIRNPFQDASGNVITFLPDSEIEITIRVRPRK